LFTSCKLAQLRAFAAAAGQTDAKPTPNLAELEAESARPAKQNRYAYGEISKAEYEKLKAQAAGPTAKTCARCGQPVEPAHKFCPHCGAKV
jgi:rubrerythrin